MNDNDEDDATRGEKFDTSAPARRDEHFVASLHRELDTVRRTLYDVTVQRDALRGALDVTLTALRTAYAAAYCGPQGWTDAERETLRLEACRADTAARTALAAAGGGCAVRTNYRNMTITTGDFGFNVEMINCFGCDRIQIAKAAIDRYLDGDKNPQCYAC